MVFGLFDHAFYLNCDHRTDRRAFFERQASIAGISVERFPAAARRDKGHFASEAAHSCQESHISIWELARERRYASVLIFEDDASLTLEGLAALQTYRDQVLSTPWDMLYFQVRERRTDQCEVLPDGVHRIRASILTHAYAVRGVAFETLIRLGRENDRLAIDLHLYENIQPLMNVYAIGPAVAFQLSSASDLRDSRRPPFAPGGLTPIYKAAI